MSAEERHYGYARVSTPDQNLDLQVEALKNAGVEERHIFTDHATGSGPIKKRHGLLMLLKGMREGDTLVVWKLDRLGRTVAELIRTLDIIRKKGADLKVLTQPIDTTTAIGKVMFNVVAAFAEFERDLISERTKAGLAEARKRGRQIGHKKKLTTDMMKEAAALLGEGYSYEAIAEKWNGKVSKSTLYNYREEIEAFIPMDVDETETDSN